jgi:hypothetical protein
LDEWLLERRPPADLAGQLVCAWRGDIGEARTLLPDECVDMFWTGGSVRVSGPETRSWPSAAAPGTDVVGVCFRSGVASLSGVAVQVAAFTGVKDRVSGLAGGMVSTAQEVGAALGLAIIATAALAQDRSCTPPAARRPSALSPRPQASSVARWWLPDSALLPRSQPGSCSGEPKRRRPRLACHQRQSPRCVRHETHATRLGSWQSSGLRLSDGNIE